MTDSLDRTAPAFVEMAHRIVWAGAATVDADGRPWSRVLHPLWTWDGAELTGIVATSPLSPKAAHLAVHPHVAFTYWHPDQDTCSAMCDATWDDTAEGRTAGWDVSGMARRNCTIRLCMCPRPWAWHPIRRSPIPETGRRPSGRPGTATRGSD